MPSSVFTALDADWAPFINSPPAADALERWKTDRLPAVANLDELVARIWAADRTVADGLLAVLARRARTDYVAARVLLQALRPGLRTLTRRLGHGKGGVDQELIAVAWELICTYPIERRPRSIAANILLDTRKRYIAATFRTDPWINLDDLADTAAVLVAAPSAEDEALDSEPASRQRVRDYLAAATTDGTITATTAEIIWRTRIVGEPEPRVALDFGCPVRTLQRRRQRAERRLRAAS